MSQTDLPSQADEIFKSLAGHAGHTVDKPEPPKLEEIKVEVAPPKVVKPPKITENKILKDLRSKFGLTTYKKLNFVINDMTFVITVVSAQWAAWAEARALIKVTEKEGYSVADFENYKKLFLASTFVESIDGQAITEIFGGDEKEARFKFAQFLISDSVSGLVSSIYTFYDENIEPLVTVTTDVKSDKQAYKCTKCGHIHAFDKREAPYYCNLDGAVLAEYAVETDLPLA